VLTGSCPCRKVRFEVRGELGSIVYCHCESCRKAQGTAFVANAPVAEDDFVVTSGAELIAKYESSPGKYRGSWRRTSWQTSLGSRRILRRRSVAHDPAIVTIDYDPRWPMTFEDEKRRLQEGLGDVAARIEHIGSTAVPGLAAKPIIDIDIYVRALDPMTPFRDPLEALGYVYQFDPMTPDLHFFGYPAERPRLFHVHVADVGSHHMQADLAVRDFLRTHSEVAEEYARLKRRLTSQRPGDRDAYIAGKATFMTALRARALRWAIQGCD
jgi:GrpB-like predicted nucleotidyltransferase (UPF0157 family)